MDMVCEVVERFELSNKRNVNGCGGHESRVKALRKVDSIVINFILFLVNIPSSYFLFAKGYLIYALISEVTFS